MPHTLDSHAIPVLAGDEGPFYAYDVAPGHWNGWVMPTLPHTECIRLATMLEVQNRESVERWGSDDAYASTLAYDATARTWTLTSTDDPEGEAYAPDAQGNYAIGAGSWCWSFATEEDSAEHVRRYTESRAV